MLNNEQLTSAIDSLQLKYQEKELLFKNNISSKYENKLISNIAFKTNISPTNKKQEYDILM
jgi:hypothetical protein